MSRHGYKLHTGPLKRSLMIERDPLRGWILRVDQKGEFTMELGLMQSIYANAAPGLRGNGQEEIVRLGALISGWHGPKLVEVRKEFEARASQEARVEPMRLEVDLV